VSWKWSGLLEVGTHDRKFACLAGRSRSGGEGKLHGSATGEKGKDVGGPRRPADELPNVPRGCGETLGDTPRRPLVRLNSLYPALRTGMYCHGFTDESSVEGTGDGNNRRPVDALFHGSERQPGSPLMRERSCLKVSR
jgi:hypothetical protein